jgi:polyferredoxin
MKKPRAIHLRRTSQLIFLLFFVILFLYARDPLPRTLPPDLLMRIDPLAGLIVLVAGRTVVTAFWPALIILLLTFALGRSFCAWICPMGTSLDIWNRMVKPGKRQGNRHWKYALLFGIILLALVSIQSAWLLDPLVIFNRSLTLSVYPIFTGLLTALLDAGMGSGLLEGLAFTLWDALQGWLLPLTPLQTGLLLTTLLFFIGILFLEKFGRRTWCRVLCPLGALYGLLSHISPFGRRVDPDCTSCALCETECRMGAIHDEDFERTRRSECILCLECSEVCEEKGTTYNWHWQQDGQEKFDFGRRRVVGVLGASVLFGTVWKAQLRDRTADGYLIRPPGAVPEDRFLDLCLRCEECVKACSSTGACLQPAGLTYGLSGFWSPSARMREGYCEYSCTLCGEVCPSGAIKPLTEEIKKSRVIGLAYINRSRCIPWETGEDCIVCEEHCPTPKKAIIFRSGTVDLPNDIIKDGVKLPYVDTELCIGCGICEYKCPVLGESAVRITRQGEQRIT